VPNNNSGNSNNRRKVSQLSHAILNNYSYKVKRFLILSFSAGSGETNNPPVVPVNRYSLARVERDLNEMWPSLAEIPRYGISLHAQTGF
jgi:hypothetical protein